MKRIPLTQGKFAIVDDEDYEELNQHKWHFRPMRTTHRNKGYAARSFWKDGKIVRVFMHRELMKPPISMQVDHVNGNGLDNQKANLRVCSQTENKRNKSAANKTSRFLGVCLDRRSGKWNASCEGKYIGQFIHEVDAARAYNQVARIRFGEFARLNEV